MRLKLDLERRMDKLTFRLAVADMLKVLREKYTCTEMARICGVNITIISRYINHDVLPDYERALSLYRAFRKDLLNMMSEGLDENNGVLLSNPSFLSLVSLDAMYRVLGKRITKVMAFDELAGLAVATSINISRPYVLITRNKSSAFKDWLSFSCDVGPVMVEYYVPKVISPKDDLLYIDLREDIFRNTVLKRICEATGCNIAYRYILENEISNWGRFENTVHDLKRR